MSILNQRSVNGKEVETEEVDETVDSEMSKEELAAFVEKVEKIIKLGEHDQKVLLVQNQIQEKHREAENAQNSVYTRTGIWASVAGGIAAVVSITALLTVFSGYFTQTGTFHDQNTMGLVLIGSIGVPMGIGAILSAFAPGTLKDYKKKDQAESKINTLRKELVEKSLDAKVLTEITDFSNNWQEIVASKDGKVKGFVIRFKSNDKNFEWAEQREFLVK